MAAPPKRPATNLQKPRVAAGAQSAEPELGDLADDSDSDDSIGPALPGQEGRGKRMGPSVPNMQDLELRKGKPNSNLAVN